MTVDETQNEMTVEFWVKPLTDTWYVGDKKVIFTLRDSIETLNKIRAEKNLTEFKFDLDDKSKDDI